MLPDVLAAVVRFIRNVPEVSALVGTRVWSAFPESEVNNMPRAAVIVQAAGMGFGPWNRTKVPLGATRYDLRCYGATPREAMTVWRAVAPAFKQMERHKDGDTLLFDAILSGGPHALIEQDTNWPLVLASYEVLAAEVAV